MTLAGARHLRSRCSWCARPLRWWQLVHCRRCAAAAANPQLPAPQADSCWGAPADPWWRS